MNLISIDDASDLLNEKLPGLGMKYHRLLDWIKKKKYGLDGISQKVGWGWVIEAEKIDEVVTAIKADPRVAEHLNLHSQK